MGKSLQCIATDSYRLAKKTIPLETEQNFSVTIPAKSLNEVSRSIQKDEPVEIALNDKKAQFYIGSTMIQTRLLDGTYPETERLIPASFSYEMVCDGADLRNAIDRTLFMKRASGWRWDAFSTNMPATTATSRRMRTICLPTMSAKA